MTHSTRGQPAGQEMTMTMVTMSYQRPAHSSAAHHCCPTRARPKPRKSHRSAEICATRRHSCLSSRNHACVRIAGTSLPTASRGSCISAAHMVSSQVGVGHQASPTSSKWLQFFVLSMRIKVKSINQSTLAYYCSFTQTLASGVQAATAPETAIETHAKQMNGKHTNCTRMLRRCSKSYLFE